MLVSGGSESALRQPISSVDHRHREHRPDTRKPPVPRRPLVVVTTPPHTTPLLILTHSDAMSPIPSAVQQAIEAHGGWAFKHTGDGVCAAFASPSCAVEAAVAAQRTLQLPVRMGIATGEAELREADYFGAVLNRAARVMASGHGGQVLLADSTAGLLSGVDWWIWGHGGCGIWPIRSGVSGASARGCVRNFRR